MKLLVLILGTLFGSLVIVGCGQQERNLGSTEVGRPQGNVRVLRVIDGDTVVLDRFGRTELAGVGAPEESRCFAGEAARFTRERLEGKDVGYQLVKQPRGRPRPRLAYLYVGDRMHNLVLLEDGYARVRVRAPDEKYVAEFNQAEDRAEDAGRGLFGGDCPRR